jgi:hypothetical protein
VPTGFAARAPRKGERKKLTGVWGGNRAQQKDFEKHTRDLAGDLLRLKRGHYITNVVYKCACMFQLQMSFIKSGFR